MIDGTWLAYLAVPTVWTIAFSLFNAPGVRGWRNLGWPSCYVVGAAMLWDLGWQRAGTTWLSVGFATGFLYYLYEVWSTRQATDPAEKAQLRTILHGALAWPIMLPEVIEYALADAGVLKASTAAEPTPGPDPVRDGRHDGEIADGR